MSSEYRITVNAQNERDAEDIARRRALDDGYRPTPKPARVIRVAPPVPVRWAVQLEVS
jgi:hypothetical protein